MGFGERLKDLRDQAQHAVADNKDKIQGAVQSVGEVANAKTKGKYADKIAKVGEKVNAGVEKIGGTETADTDASAAPAATTPESPVNPASADEAAAGFPPEFE